MNATIETYEAHFYIEMLESDGSIRVMDGIQKIPSHLGQDLLKKGIYQGDEHDTSIPGVMNKLKTMGFEIIDNYSSRFTSPGVFKKNSVEIRLTDREGKIEYGEAIESISGKDLLVARKILGPKPIVARGWYQVPGKDYKSVHRVNFQKQISYREMSDTSVNPFEIIIGDQIPVEYLTPAIGDSGYLDITVKGYGPVIEDDLTGKISYELATAFSTDKVSKRTEDIKLSRRQIKKAFGEKRSCLICWLIGLFKKGNYIFPG